MPLSSTTELFERIFNFFLSFLFIEQPANYAHKAKCEYYWQPTPITADHPTIMIHHSIHSTIHHNAASEVGKKSYYKKQCNKQICSINFFHFFTWYILCFQFLFFDLTSLLTMQIFFADVSN